MLGVVILITGFGSIMISEEVKAKQPKVSYADLYQVFYYSGDLVKSILYFLVYCG